MLAECPLGDCFPSFSIAAVAQFEVAFGTNDYRQSSVLMPGRRALDNHDNREEYALDPQEHHQRMP